MYAISLTSNWYFFTAASEVGISTKTNATMLINTIFTREQCEGKEVAIIIAVGFDGDQVSVNIELED